MNLSDQPYTYMLDSYFRKLFKPEKPVRHQQICPVCGRKMVNTYRKNGIWKCKQCWDKDGE